MEPDREEFIFAFHQKLWHLAQVIGRKAILFIDNVSVLIVLKRDSVNHSALVFFILLSYKSAVILLDWSEMRGAWGVARAR